MHNQRLGKDMGYSVQGPVFRGPSHVSGVESGVERADVVESDRGREGGSRGGVGASRRHLHRLSADTSCGSDVSQWHDFGWTAWAALRDSD
eukprot:2210033-Rhodomonas_salina.2